MKCAVSHVHILLVRVSMGMLMRFSALYNIHADCRNAKKYMDKDGEDAPTTKANKAPKATAKTKATAAPPSKRRRRS